MHRPAATRQTLVYISSRPTTHSHTSPRQERACTPHPCCFLKDIGATTSGSVEKLHREWVGLREWGHRPHRTTPSWQAHARQGFDAACFAIDWEAQTVTCPQGRVSHLWILGREWRGQEVIRFTFHPRDCAACPRRPHCTHAKRGPRKLGLLPRAIHTVLQSARQRQQTAAFKTQYARRAGVEGTISQGVRRCDLRHARYRGLEKTRLQHVATAVAINLCRLDDWWTETARAQTRVSPFAALVAA